MLREAARRGQQPVAGIERSLGLATALTALEAGRCKEAERQARQSLEQQPSDIEAQTLLGLALGVGGDVEQAAGLLDGVARARSTQVHPACKLARLLLRQERTDRIAPMFRACLGLAPDNISLRYAFAEFQRGIGEAPDEAVALLAPVLRACSGRAGPHFEMGLAMVEAGRFAEAAEQFRRTVAIDPAPAPAWANLGLTLDIEGRFDEALEAYSQAIARSPNNTQMRANRAAALLRAGRMSEAWHDEAWRFTPPGGGPLLPQEKLLPRLSRLPDLTGRVVLVVHDEGLGDTLQFLRYLPLLAERGAKIVVAVPPELVRVMRTIRGVAAVPDGDVAVPDYDFQCSFSNLPQVFETTLETIPDEVPYIIADPAMVAYWAKKLPAYDGFRAGLVWSGATRPWQTEIASLVRRRNMTLASFAPLAAVRGVCFVSLQKGAASSEAAADGAIFNLFDPMDEVRDFADTAAIIANLDVVISVDTSTGHLASAMGKPVLMLDRYDNCWRWLSGREDSPWYPFLRIFRQQRSGEWGPVIDRVSVALAEMIAKADELTANPRRCRR